MKNLTNRWARPVDMKAMIPQFSRLHLIRSFVDTGDERCPIAASGRAWRTTRPPTTVN